MASPFDTFNSLASSYLGYGTPIDILLNVVLPIPIIAYAIYLLLEDLKIFSSSQTVRALIGIAMGVFIVLVGRVGSIALWGGILGILILKIPDWSGRLIALGIFFLIFTQITNLDILGMRPSQILYLGAAVAALVGLTMTHGWKQRIFLLIIIIAVVLFISSYLLPQLRI